ncbi:MAG: arginine repressor [Bacteroidales bacterium]
MNKKTRLSKIVDLIQKKNISSQEMLVAELAENDIQVTQATLSRDLKTLNVIKVIHPEKGYIYSLPSNIKDENELSVFANAFKGITFSGNMAVVKTLPAFANSIASMIDSYQPEEIIGSIAGDDTILLILNEDIKDRDLIKSTLKKILPGISGKI